MFYRRTLQFFFDLTHSRPKVCFIHWFKKVIYCAYPEGPGCELIVSCGKYNGKIQAWQHFQHFETIHPWHFHIEEDEIRVEFPDGKYRFLARVTNILNRNLRTMFLKVIQ